MRLYGVQLVVVIVIAVVEMDAIRRRKRNDTTTLEDQLTDTQVWTKRVALPSPFKWVSYSPITVRVDKA